MSGYLWEAPASEAFKALLTGEEILSYKEIAALMTVLFHYPFTKNMCIGKAHRLGFKPREKEKRGGAERVINLAKVREVSAPIEPPEEYLMEPSEKVTFDQLRPGCCKYPSGHHPNLFFCGEPQQDETPYCATHYALTHVNPARQRQPGNNGYALR